jgi:hypothetical protein
MDKKLVYIGVVMIIIGMALAYQVSSSIFQLPSYYSREVLLAPNNIEVGTFQFNRSLGFAFIYNSTEPINFYVLNYSAYKSINYSLIKSQKNEILHNVTGLFDEIIDKKYGVFSNFIYLNRSEAESYNTTNMQNGTYYLLFYNLGNRTANIYEIYVEKNFVKGYSNSFFLVYSSISAIMTIGGLVIIVYGILKRNKSNANKEQEEKKRLQRRKAKLIR